MLLRSESGKTFGFPNCGRCVSLGQMLLFFRIALFLLATFLQAVPALSAQSVAGERAWSCDSANELWVEKGVLNSYAVATVGHPFLVLCDESDERECEYTDDSDARWIVASRLKIGDVFVGANNKTVEIEGLRVVELFEKVYNMEIAEWNNYGVGKERVVTHNTNDCSTEAAEAPNKVGGKGAFNEAERDAGIPRTQQPDRKINGRS